MSVALPQPVSAIYREEQNFAWWLYGLLALMAGLGIVLVRLHHGSENRNVAVPGTGWNVEVPIPILVGIGLPTILVIGVLHMTTEVTPEACRVWFGWVPTFRRSIPLGSIRAVEIVEYNAWRDHGFWGVRLTRDGERVMTARGNRAVRIYLADGTRYLIGTQRPEELAGVLERERRLYS
ncbi:MAG: hypothetical protein KatS3mg108_1515 [Isosphaeraceae bacterium]|nr:MAG: hypothetical protein KatS3mg108_1515 [Isosphaeraceae bacterium]